MLSKNKSGVVINLECDKCGIIFQRFAFDFNPKQTKIFCSLACTRKTDEEKIKTRRDCRKRWRDSNKDHAKHLAKTWRLNNQEKIKEYKKTDWIKNKDTATRRNRDWYIKHCEAVKARNKVIYAKNKEKIKSRAKAWSLENKDWISERSKKYRKDNPARAMLYRVKTTCKKLGIECDMTEEWFRERLSAGVCEMSGIPFDGSGRSPNAPSIDRIVAGGPYSVENCRLILWSINHALSDRGEDYMINVFSAILRKRSMTCDDPDVILTLRN